MEMAVGEYLYKYVDGSYFLYSIVHGRVTAFSRSDSDRAVHPFSSLSMSCYKAVRGNGHNSTEQNKPVKGIHVATGHSRAVVATFCSPPTPHIPAARAPRPRPEARDRRNNEAAASRPKAEQTVVMSLAHRFTP